MAWSWLGLLMGFALPLAVYVASYFRARFFSPQRKEIVPILIAVAASLCSSAAIILLIFSSPYWRDGTRIVWSEMQAHGEPLIIGGEQEETAIAWPNEATFPKLKVTPQQGGQKAAVQISEGGAFIFDEQKQRFLNGKPVAIGGTERFGDYQIRVNHLGWPLFHLLKPQIEVVDASGQSLVGFDLRINRTRPLQYLLPGNMAEPLTGPDKIAEREKLEDWASDIWLVRTDGERIYVLTASDSVTVESDLPADLTVKWANLTLPIKIGADGRSTMLEFASPWRLSSPLPPRKIEGCPEAKNKNPNDLGLIVTTRVNPCETALVLPFGRMAGDVRQPVTIGSDNHKFNSPGAVDNEAPVNCPPGVKCEARRVGTSYVPVQGSGNFSFNLRTVNDLPSRKGILVLILLALILFIAGLALIYPRMPETNRWVVYGILTAIWLFLSLRLLLAFRYALDPVALDRLSVSGVTRAFFGLMIVPGLLILWTRLRSDRHERPAEEELRRRAMHYALLYLLGIILFGLCALYFSARLWTGLPENYYYSIGDIISFQGLTFIGIVCLVALVLALHIRFLYGEPDSKGILVRYFVESWYVIENYVDKTRDYWTKHLKKTPRRMVIFGAGILLVLSFLWLLFSLGRPFLPGDKTAQELAVPIIFYWIALLWIGLKLYLQSAGHLSWRQNFWIILSALLMISLPAIAVPFVISDFGSVLPVLAILLPLVAVLLVGRSLRTGIVFLASGVALFLAGVLLPPLLTLSLLTVALLIGVFRDSRPLKAGLAVASGVLLLFLLGGLFYQNLEGMILPNAKYIPLIGGQGRVFARLLNYKKGSLAQRSAVLANSIAGGEGLPYQELLNGNQHTWENKAIAHEGGWSGLGFGEAPVQRSHVRRDTLQYDSVFSFFIVSEYGLIGGLLLLFMYACPLLIIFLGGRDRFDAGYAVAMIIASAFLIESLYHAGMNLGAFPMSGRNLPLLSVNSPSDLLRWTLLWGLALQTIFWRYEGRGRIKDEATSLISGTAQSAAPIATVASTTTPTREPRWPYLIAVWLIPGLIALTVFINGLGVLRAQKEFEKFDYELILNDVRWYLEDGVIEFDKRAKKLIPHTERLDDPDARDFILQEVARFNARTERERLEEIRDKREEQFEDRLKTVASVREYQQLLKEISSWKQPESRRSIFRLVPLHDELGRIVDYRIATNPDFNVSYSFNVGLTARDLPKVTYGDQLLLAPAWASGRYQTAISPNAPLPWVVYMRDAMEAEWLRLKKVDPARAPALYGTLTLNKSLHEAAMNFMSTKGMGLHESLIRINQGTSNFRDKLPPRVALSIISLPTGETLALGGWPRMTSRQNTWEIGRVEADNKQQDYWLPSARWLEREASQSIGARYKGDRNFDRSVVMGSSTKPLWALAVLKVHPKLAENLQVTVAGGEEQDVFGLQIKGKPWDLNGRGGDWLGFRNYLKQSDNRYHIRLGFLGLAEKDGNNIKASGPSSSRNESLTGDKKPWGRYPQFLSIIKIAQQSPPEMLTLGPNPGVPNTALADSELAKALRGMFSISMKGVTSAAGEQYREFSFRRSFWTRDETDDPNLPGSKVTGLFDRIAPEAPDFAFDKLYEPRDYVTMLLGSGTNLWSNVDFAAAFGSCLTGKPVLAHIVRGDGSVQPLEGRNLLDTETAFKLRAGLRDVVEDKEGTAYKALESSRKLPVFKGYSFYAKTGTLKVDEDSSATSRIVLAIVKWKDERKGEVASGLVFSVVAEKGGMGTAANWLNEFIAKNKDTIAALLKDQR